jgi:hypothetical protein
MDAANQADPTFDENASHARYAARQQFTGMGKGSQTVQAAERFASHVNDLYEASNKLAGPNLGFAPLSNLATSAAQAFDQKDVATYNAPLPFIAGELQKLTKNGAATEGESQLIMKNLQPGQPRDVRNAAIKELVKLGRAQLDPMREAWASAWNGVPPPPMPMDFNPATLAIFDAVDNEKPPLKRDAKGAFIVPGTTSTGSGPGGTTPPPGTTPLGFNGPNPLDPSGGPSGTPMTVAQGATRNIPDPKVSSLVASMINAGAGLPDINAALAQQQADPIAPAEFQAVQQWMHAHPGKQYPAGSVDAHHTAPLSLMQRAAGSALGAGVANFANSAAGGIPAYLAGDQGAGAIDAMNATHGPASTIGSIGGGLASAAGGELGAASVAKSLFTNPEALATALKFAPRISDAVQGGVQGYTGSGGNLGDAALGAIAAPLAGKFGEKAVHAVGSAAKGVMDPSVQYLRGLKIPLTVGQTLGNSGWLGSGIKKTEDALTALPGVGNMVEARQTDSLRGMNHAAFNIGAQTTGNEVQDYGQKGLQQLAALKNQTYSNALDPVTIDASSPQFVGDVGNTVANARQIPPVEGARAAALAALQSRIGGAVDPVTETINGRGFQEAYRGLARTAKERAAKDYGYETGQVMQQGKDALTAALEDQNPGAYQGFLNGNAANRRLNVLAKAVDLAKNQKENLFSAAQLNSADAGNASQLVGRIASASGDRPFAELAGHAQAVLPSKVPDSGTATRAMVMRGLTGAGLFGSTTGAGYLAGDTGAGAETGLGTMAVLGLLGSKAAQRAMVKALADRPDWLRAAGSSIQNYAPVGGILGTGAALNRLSYGQ